MLLLRRYWPSRVFQRGRGACPHQRYSRTHIRPGLLCQNTACLGDVCLGLNLGTGDERAATHPPPTIRGTATSHRRLVHTCSYLATMFPPKFAALVTVALVSAAAARPVVTSGMGDTAVDSDATTGRFACGWQSDFPVLAAVAPIQDLETSNPAAGHPGMKVRLLTMRTAPSTRVGGAKTRRPPSAPVGAIPTAAPSGANLLPKMQSVPNLQCYQRGSSSRLQVTEDSTDEKRNGVGSGGTGAPAVEDRGEAVQKRSGVGTGGTGAPAVEGRREAVEKRTGVGGGGTGAQAPPRSIHAIEWGTSLASGGSGAPVSWAVNGVEAEGTGKPPSPRSIYVQRVGS
ncbi:hypothetical protein B0H17DRAFT_1337966, partial [Mycena rosella]